MNVYLFNPQNDLALAADTDCFTPPRNAAWLARCGAMLPLWYAEEDDCVLGETDMRWLDGVHRYFNLGATATAFVPQLATGFSPWGWSANARNIFLKAGANPNLLPSTQQIAEMRNLSHRRTVIEILSRLRNLGLFAGDLPVEALCNGDVQKFAEKHGANGFFFKAPWSSSGRGVACSLSMPAAELQRRSAGIIHNQGSVMLEPRLDRVLDFAMLFENHANEGTTFSGYSLFATNGNAYSGNILAPDSKLRDILIKNGADEDTLHSLEDALPKVLSEITSMNYNGPLGVDMMLHRTGENKISIHPCIEMNLRRTMGFVALDFRNRHLCPDSVGELKVEFSNKQKPEREMDLSINSNRLEKGTLDLVPPMREGFRIVVNATVESECN